MVRNPGVNIVLFTGSYEVGRRIQQLSAEYHDRIVATETGSKSAVIVCADARMDLAVTASIMLLIEIGAGGETALLPLLVTSHLHLSAATAGTAMLAVGLLGGLLLVPGGNASDRWGRRPTMIAGSQNSQW